MPTFIMSSTPSKFSALRKLLTLATAVLPLLYVKEPPLLDVGAVKVKAFSPKVLAVMVKLLRLGAIGLTVKLAVIVPDV